MSDFDKEAERERLREKYERDEQKREVTERMSELLLKGATMTNAHCEQCGDPIFRYDGQEFCATCQRAVERPGRDEPDAADDTAEADADETSANGDTEELEVATPSEETVRFGGDAGETPADEDRERLDASQSTDHDTADDPNRRETPGPSTAAEGSAPESAVTTDSTAGAEAELARTIALLARRAAASEDPGQAKALLEAAREAAEALAALRH